MAAADFLRRKHDVTLAFFHHMTPDCAEAERAVIEYAEEHSLPVVRQVISKECPLGKSGEEHWRDERYKFLESLGSTVVTAHTLNDCVETYVWSSLHGNPKVIPYQRNNVVRPFLLTTKDDFLRWAKHNDIVWHEDSSNENTVHMRNYVRHELMPHALHVNPGLYKVVKRIVEKRNGCNLNQTVQ